MMRQSGLLRAQKLILGILTLALVMVLVALGSLVRRDVPASPLPSVIVSDPQTRATAQMDGTPSPVPPTRISPTTPTLGAPEVLAARRIDALVTDVGEIRELPKQQEIPLNFSGAQELAAYLRRILADTERQAYAQRQQALLAALGLLPDLDRAYPPTVQARARHLIGFYDRVEAQVYVSLLARDSEPPDISLVHQYAHAIVDQHFDLLAFADAAPNADAARARDALVEGDATMVLAQHSLGGAYQGQLVELADHLSQVELTDYEGYLTSRAMRDAFAFPYLEGTRFVAALLQAGWWPAVNTAYLDPPVSTEQILHPEKYVDTPRDLPQTVQLPDLSEGLGEGWRLAGQAVLGELILRAHLDQYLSSTPEAQVAAAGWDGDLAALWHHTDDRDILVMRILWDDAGEAAEFFRSYVNVINRRLRSASRVLRPIVPPGGRWWRGEGENVYIQREQNAVLVVWSPDTDTMEGVLEVFVFGEE